MMSTQAADNNNNQDGFQHSTSHVSQVVPLSMNSSSNPVADIQLIQFKNTLVLQIRYNGELDTTFRVPLSDRTYLSNIISQNSVSGDSEEVQDYDQRHGLSKQQMVSSADIDVVCLAGITGGRQSIENAKLRVLASQIMILLVSLNKFESRDILLNVSSNFFRSNKNDQDPNKNNDFNILMFLLKLVKEVYLQ